MKCYFHGAGISDQNGGGFLLLFYLMNGNKAMYDTDFNKDRNNFDWEACRSGNGAVGEELCDFGLKYGEVAFEADVNDFREYQMIAIVLEDNYIKLKSYEVAFESKWDKRDGVHINPFGSDFTLISAKKYNQACFNFGDPLNDFYFISFNNISDFSCGYSTKGFYEDNWFYFDDITIKNFSDSPFDFIDEVEIIEMKIISNYRYAQYTIENKQNGEIYHGLFDIKTNKIMFNTNETLDMFLPYSNNSMLAVKGNTAYRICPIMNEDGTDCLENCTGDGDFLIRDVTKNFCGTKCSDEKYLLVPDNICDTSCNTSIYVVDEENKKCGLCKDMDEKPYRFIGGDICLNEIPEGGYEYNSKLKLLKCKSGYKTDPSNVNSCVTNCHSSCKTCSDYSTNDDDPKCLSCENGFKVDNKKCVEIVIPTTTIVIPPTTIVIPPPTTIVIPPPTTIVIPPPTTVVIPPKTVVNPPTTIVIPPTTIVIPPTTVVNPPTTVVNPPTTILEINLNISEIISEFDGDNLIFNDSNKIHQISYLNNQSQYFSVVNLGFCENILKEENNIDINDELIIYKTDYNFPEFQIPIIDYEIYDKSGKKLNLDCCSNTSINFEIPVTINEDELYKYDPNSFYYNDKCHPAESDNNIDLTIYDRKNEFNDKDMSLCQTNCNYKGYNKNTKKAICECSKKSEIPFDQILNVDKDKLIKKFLNVKDLVNIDVIKCYRLIFYENGLEKNSGNYILLCIISISIISMIILFIKEVNNIKIMLENIFETKKNKNGDLNSEIKIFKKIIKTVNNPIKKTRKNELNKNENMKSKSNFISFSNIKDDNKDNKLNMSDKNLVTKKDEIIINEQYNDFEINNLSYEKAKKIDKRTFWEYYFSLIKTKELAIFTFYLSTDYNLRMIKINLFFLTFALNLTVNACFFNDSTMHKIYEDEGSYNFAYQLPQIIYSLIITVLIKTALSLLSLTEKSIVKIKQNKKIEMNIINKGIKCIKIKLIIFFVLEFIFLAFFWFYVSCFCALYRNTQSHLVKDTLTSFALSLLYPFALNLIPGLFRISSLKTKNNDSKCLYKVSTILQLI